MMNINHGLKGQTPRVISDSVDRSADYDVIIIGGAFSGSSSALLLKRTLPDLRILVIERTTEFDRKVGESTSEVAGTFMTRVLKLGMHLARDHVAKHGLRMWFHKNGENAPGRCSEVGPAFQGRVTTYQVNRRKLDRHVLSEATALGVDLIRPATIKEIELGGIGKNKISYKEDATGERHTVTAGWVIDASGKAAKIAKQRKTFQSNADRHPTAAMWARFENVTFLDSHEATTEMADACKKMVTQRGFATNHLMGYGWWCWIIPLDSGEVSVGLTWDATLFTPPEGKNMGERVKKHVLQHPIGRLMFEKANAVEGDNRYYKGLSYYSTEVCGEGFTLVGDASGFMDPLYSQGLDYCSHTVYSSFALLRDYYSGDLKCLDTAIANRNREFLISYNRWFESLYEGKYTYLGDAEIMRASFLLDIATYFLGPVNLVLIWEDQEFTKLPYHGLGGSLFAKFMTFYNRRFNLLARKKIHAGKYGDKNLDKSWLITGSFTPGPSRSTFKLFFKAIRVWLWTELRYAFRKAAPIPDTPTRTNPMPAPTTPVMPPPSMEQKTPA